LVALGIKSGNKPSNTMIHTISEGTSEIQQLIIARAIFGLRIEETAC